MFKSYDFKSFISKELDNDQKIAFYEKVYFLQAIEKYEYNSENNTLIVYSQAPALAKLKNYEDILKRISLKYFNNIPNSINIDYKEIEEYEDQESDIEQKRVGKNIMFSEKNIIRNDLLFENYITDETNNQAYNVASNIAHNQIDNYMIPVFIFEGPTGVGKTHLVSAIANSFISKFQNKIGYFFTKNYYQTIIKESFAKRDTNEVFKRICDSDVVIFDDLAFITELPNSSYIKLIYDILDNRIMKKLPTVLTTPIPVADMSFKFHDINEKTAYFDKKNDYFYFSKPFLSRLSSYVVKINPPSFELKKNFFIKKINKQLGLNVKNCDKNINEQIDFLLCSIEADFRLVDMYTQYVIDSYLIYKNIEAALKNVLTKYFKYDTKDKQTFTRLHYLTNKISECTNTDIVALAKKRRIQKPDELILLDLTVYVLREISNISLKDIANFFNKDKSSISKKCKNFKQRLESGDKTAKYYLDILIEEDAIK